MQDGKAGQADWCRSAALLRSGGFAHGLAQVADRVEKVARRHQALRIDGARLRPARLRKEKKEGDMGGGRKGKRSADEWWVRVWEKQVGAPPCRQ